MAPSSPLRPYFGIGAGEGKYRLEAIPSLAAAPAIDAQAYAIAYQGIIGLGFEIAEHAMLTFDCRHLVAENIKLADAIATPFEIYLVQSTFMLGLHKTF